MSINPLGLLSADEIEHATAAFAAANKGAKLTFYEVSLHEPFTTKEKAAAMSGGGDLSKLPRRRAKIVASDTERQCVLEGHAPVDGTSSSSVVVKMLTGTQPPLTAAEYALCERLTVEYEPFRESLRDHSSRPFAACAHAL